MFTEADFNHFVSMVQDTEGMVVRPPQLFGDTLTFGVIIRGTYSQGWGDVFLNLTIKAGDTTCIQVFQTTLQEVIEVLRTGQIEKVWAMVLGGNKMRPPQDKWDELRQALIPHHEIEDSPVVPAQP